MFYNLHCHSNEYDCDGRYNITDLLKFAKEEKISALAITNQDCLLDP